MNLEHHHLFPTQPPTRASTNGRSLSVTNFSTYLMKRSQRPSDNGRRNCRLSRGYSINSLRTEFVSRLPDKVCSGLDVESSPYDIDLTRTSGLSGGLFELQLKKTLFGYWENALNIFMFFFSSRIWKACISHSKRWFWDNSSIPTSAFCPYNDLAISLFDGYL